MFFSIVCTVDFIFWSVCMKLLLAPLLLLAAVPALAQLSQPTVGVNGTLLNISASAEATRIPDVARISAGVVTQATDSNSALRANAQQMDKVMAAIKKSGIAERDVQTSGVSLNPQYKYEDNKAPQIVGYQASNTVNIKVRDISKLGAVLDVLADQGANQINGPMFSIDQPEPVYDQARMDALKKAQERAQTYAKNLNLRVVRIVSIDETNNGGFQPMAVLAAAPRAAKEFNSPISPGETTLSVTLNVVFELGR